MKFIETDLPGVLILVPVVFSDERGFFMETQHRDKFADAGITLPFVQDNHSHSVKGTVRGLHFQEPHGQGKLIRVVNGEILDVAVDIRRGSPHFGCWTGERLSVENRRQLWVPPGFAQGYCALTDRVDVIYKCTEVYAPEAEQIVLWNDPGIGVDWPVEDPLLSERDAGAPLLSEIENLPTYSATSIAKGERR